MPNISAARARGRKPKLSPEVRAYCISKLNSSEYDTAALCKELNIHPTTLRNVCKSGINIANSTSDKCEIPGFSGYFADANGEVYSKRQGFFLRKLTQTKCGKQLKVAVIADGEEKKKQHFVRE